MRKEALIGSVKESWMKVQRVRESKPYTTAMSVIQIADVLGGGAMMITRDVVNGGIVVAAGAIGIAFNEPLHKKIHQLMHK